MTFFERLESLIKEKKTSQKAVAEYVGLTGSSITLWKKEGTIPRADVALRIAEFLGVSVEYLITGAESVSKPDTAPIIAHLEAALDDLKRL
ncbi:MAG: helix-turn-helix domain-containing protein [Treponema sp.]|jgi:transcriptional regulator with XRE-family HTH domain|nr:helix-turn-helix domain-containing protein [Treponema sp.]